MVKITPKPLPKCYQHNIHPTAFFEAHISTISTPTGAWNTACLIQTNITGLLSFWVFILLNWAFFILTPTLDKQLPWQYVLRAVFNLHLKQGQLEATRDFPPWLLKAQMSESWQCLLKNCTLSHTQKVKEPNTLHLLLLQLPLHSFNCVLGPHQVLPGPYIPCVLGLQKHLLHHHKHCSERLSQLSMKKNMSCHMFANNVHKNLLVMQPHELARWCLVLKSFRF